ETIRRMIRHYEKLLEAAVEIGEERVCRLEMMNAAEKEQVRREWNRTDRQYEVSTGEEKIEEQAERRAEAVAVSYEDEQLSYGELNRRANQVANYLRRAGVGREAVVGICMERSVEMVVGLLGILKAGGAYLPLDPGYPQERVAYMEE